jgi:hypothetical protein
MTGRRIGYSGWAVVIASLAVVLGLAAGTPTLAGAGSDTAIEGYALNLEDRVAETPALIAAPLPLSIGLYGMNQKRELSFSDDGVKVGTLRHIGAILGVDATSWLTIQALAGSSDIDPGMAEVGRIDGDVEWGMGIKARLINWQVEPIMGNISWIRFDASACYRNAAADDGDNKANWQEGYSDFTVSLVTTPPKKDETVRSISIFAGPAVSWIDGTLETAEGGSSDFSEEQLIGYTAGIVMVPHDNISLKLEAQFFKKVSYGAAVGFHF